MTGRKMLKIGMAVTFIALILLVFSTSVVARFIHLIQISVPDSNTFAPVIFDANFSFIPGAKYRYRPEFSWPSRYEIGLKISPSNTSIVKSTMQAPSFDGEIVIRYLENNKVLMQETILTEKATGVNGSEVNEVILYTLNLPRRGFLGNPEIEIEILRTPSSLPPSRISGLYIALSSLL